MATIDELHAQSVSQDIGGLKGALIKALRGAAEFVSPPADGPGAAVVSGIRSLLPGHGTFSQEFDRYNRDAAPSPLYSGPERFGSVVKAPGAVGQSEGEKAQAQAMAMQTAMVAAIRQAAFRNRKTGEIRETGPLHDPDQLGLPESYTNGRMEALNQWEDGFTTDKGKFLNRTEAAEHVGSRRPELDALDTVAGRKEFGRVSGDSLVDFDRIRGPAVDAPSPEAAAAKVLREGEAPLMRRGWEGWPWDEYSQERPRPKDVPPNRPVGDDFMVYHGTSGDAAEKIMAEKLLRPDDLGKVGVGTAPEQVSIYGHIRGRKDPTVLEILLDKDGMAKYRAEHEGGGSGFNQFLLSPEDGTLRGWGGVPLKGVRAIKRNGEWVKE